MNTATYRGMAQNAEKRLDWQTAAKFWKLAITKYPSKGALATLDIEKMTAKMNAAKAMATQKHAAN
jgi:hypothetical protein